MKPYPCLSPSWLLSRLQYEACHAALILNSCMVSHRPLPGMTDADFPWTMQSVPREYHFLQPRFRCQQTYVPRQADSFEKNLWVNHRECFIQCVHILFVCSFCQFFAQVFVTSYQPGKSPAVGLTFSQGEKNFFQIVCFLYTWQMGDCSGQFVDSRRVDRVGFPSDKHRSEITSDNGFSYYFCSLIHSDKR